MLNKRIHFIGCGVLKLDMDKVSEELGIEFSSTWLEGGLHSKPNELRRRLQAAIDDVDYADLIAVGYGLCGRGTVDIHARAIPLAIPKVHDCIALFLGSDDAYGREFSRCPGTYYISAGWYEEKVQPKQGATHVPKDAKEREENPSYQYLVDKYGTDNAEEIVHFLSSWQRNYQRSVFIDTGTGKKQKYARYAEDMASEFDWDYQKLEGSLELLKKLIAPEGNTEILLVPPGNITVFDPRTKKLSSAPAQTTAIGGTGKTSADEGTPSDNTRTPALSSYDAERSERFGLGIDAGGTYTDVVVFDFTSREVLETAKALTTKWDYTVGINNALDEVSSDWYRKIDLVAVSTTLATNAIVEGTGQLTGLILMMPPLGILPEEFSVPTKVVSGKVDISGNELEPVDIDEIKRTAATLVKKHKCRAFAVSGYAGAVNPAHEIAAKEAIIQQTGLEVCCGHELSDLLDFRVRAHTAVLNAGIIPLLERFLGGVDSSLQSRGVSAPVMVVKGDGTLMQASQARLHPVETVLSGPAASIAGARYLTRLSAATIIDVGGTTSDIGRLDNGHVGVCEKGAVVGTWRTHVQAVDMHTLGLGGDSEVYVEKQELSVGPRRIAPVCWLASSRDCHDAFEHVRNNVDYYADDTRLSEMFVVTGRPPDFSVNDHEIAILESLKKAPKTTLMLVEETGAGHPALLRMGRLEEEFIIQRCGLTPTDLLHTTGAVSLWDGDASATLLMLVSEMAGYTAEKLRENVFTAISERLIFELVKRQLPLEYLGETLEESATAKALFDALLKGGNEHFSLSAELKQPVIGLGAAAEFFLKSPAQHLSAKLVIPRHASVANAIGAITSLVHVIRRGSITPTPNGTFLLSGVAGSEQYRDFQEAHDCLISALQKEVRTLAQDAGTLEEQVDIDVDDRMGIAADGTKVFLERTIVAGITGVPVGVSAAKTA